MSRKIFSITLLKIMKIMKNWEISKCSTMEEEVNKL